MQRIRNGRYPAHSHLNRKDRGAILSFEAKPQGGQLRPLSVMLIIPYPKQDNKFFYGVLAKYTVNTLYEEDMAG